MGNTTMLFILIVVGITLVVYALVNRIANARSNQRYGAGEHSIVIRYAKGEPTVSSSYDEGELHEWRDAALTKRNVRSVDILYANGEREHCTK